MENHIFKNLLREWRVLAFPTDKSYAGPTAWGVGGGAGGTDLTQKKFPSNILFFTFKNENKFIMYLHS